MSYKNTKKVNNSCSDNGCSVFLARALLATQVNLRNLSHRSDETGSWGTLVLKLKVDVTRSLNQGYQWSHRKDLCLPKIKKPNAESHTLDLKGRRKSYQNNCFGSVTHLTVVRLARARHLPPPPFLPQFSYLSQR